jgi:hypothetical protein
MKTMHSNAEVKTNTHDTKLNTSAAHPQAASSLAIYQSWFQRRVRRLQLLAPAKR